MLEIDIDNKAVIFKRLTDNQIPYIGYYNRYEEQVIGVDSSDKVVYIANAKLSRTGKIIAISCIQLI